MKSSARGAVGGAGGGDPDLLEHLALLGPADELADEGADALVDRGGLAVLGDVVGAVGDVRAGDAVAGAVDGEGGGEVELLGDLGRGVDPVVPGGAVAGEGDAGLLEEGGVGEAAGQGELGHEAGDGLRAVGAHPVERVGEVGAPVVGVREVGGEVEPVVGLLLEVGDAGDVGALAGLELDRQLLLDHLVGDVVEDDVDAGVLGHEALEQVLDDGALDAVGVPHQPHVAGRRPGVASMRAARRGRSSSFMVVLPWKSSARSVRVPSRVQRAGSRVRPSAVTVPSGLNSTTP